VLSLHVTESTLAISTSRFVGLLQELSQVGLEDLAVAVLGEALDEPVVAWPLVARDVVEAEGVKVTWRDACFRARHDERNDLLPPFGMLAADHSAFKHHRMGEQNLLQLSGVDVGAARDDQVLGAILEGEEAFTIGKSHIAGPEPAVAQGFGIGLGVIPIAAHDAIRAGYHLADFASRKLTTVVVDNKNVDAAARHATGGKDFLAVRMVSLSEQPLRDKADRHG